MFVFQKVRVQRKKVSFFYFGHQIASYFDDLIKKRTSKIDLKKVSVYGLFPSFLSLRIPDNKKGPLFKNDFFWLNSEVDFI